MGSSSSKISARNTTDKVLIIQCKNPDNNNNWGSEFKLLQGQTAVVYSYGAFERVADAVISLEYKKRRVELLRYRLNNHFLNIIENNRVQGSGYVTTVIDAREGDYDTSFETWDKPLRIAVDSAVSQIDRDIAAEAQKRIDEKNRVDHENRIKAIEAGDKARREALDEASTIGDLTGEKQQECLERAKNLTQEAIDFYQAALKIAGLEQEINERLSTVQNQLNAIDSTLRQSYDKAISEFNGLSTKEQDRTIKQLLDGLVANLEIIKVQLEFVPNSNQESVPSSTQPYVSFFNSQKQTTPETTLPQPQSSRSINI